MRHRTRGRSSSPDALDAAVSAVRLLGDRTRLRILLALAEGEANVGELQNRLRLPQPLVSHNLGLLRGGNFVVRRRDGKRIFYKLAAPSAGGGTIAVGAGAFRITITPAD